MMTEREDNGSTRGREPVVECRDLVCGYGDVAILEDINVDIYRGQITVLLGGSGSGKSTLLKTIIGLLPPLSGEVRVLGENVYELEPEERSQLLQRTGMLYQYGALFGSQSIYDNITLPLREHADLPEPVMREMVRQRLAIVGLEGLSHRLPSDISGGQRKRVAMARATIMDPEIVFADEPSAGLDPIVAAGLDEVLRGMQRLFKMSMIVVTHELESIKILADRVVMLADGRIRAIGTLEELANSDIEYVHDFFHRVAPNYVETGGGQSVLAALTGGE